MHNNKIFLFLAFSVCELTNNKHVTNTFGRCMMYKIVFLSKRLMTCISMSLSSICSPDVEIYFSLCPNSALVLKLLIYIFRVWKVWNGKIRYMYLYRSPIWDLFAIFKDLLWNKSPFSNSIVPMCSATLVCALGAGLTQLCDGGDQEEDAGDEGGEGQPDGPLWQLRAGCQPFIPASASYGLCK